MKPELQEQLNEEFPTLFSGPYGKGLGCDCSDGWFDLIYGLSKIISSADPNCVAEQIKEKFGGLRYYVCATTSEVHDLIHACESLSFHICEKCGSSDNVETKGPGWIHSLCAECRETKRVEDEAREAEWVARREARAKREREGSND